MPTPKLIPRPTFDVESPNAAHQADLLFLPHDRPPRGKKVYKYAFTVVNVASTFKTAEPLNTIAKNAKIVHIQFLIDISTNIYRNNTYNMPF